ncbi:amidohydrolase family protein [Bauldia sp.]|uniref:amidohydrolase family protein n=1 Tax=Bauldia sp. TaxID=2575872 RepID=UPI003BA856C2
MPLSPEARKALEARLRYLESVSGITIDADTHVSDPARLPPDVNAALRASPDYFHGKPMSGDDLIAEMDMASVDGALTWQNPSATAYTDSQSESYDALLAANATIAEAACTYPERIFPAGWTDPRALGVDGAIRMIDTGVDRFGFPIIKLNPAQNGFRIDSEPVLACVDRIVARGAFPAFHYGADTPFTPPEGFAAIAMRHPTVTVIGVHMGGGGAGYVEGERHAQESRRMLHDLPNVFFIESAKRDTHIESDLIDAATSSDAAWRRIAVGSDAPYGRMTWNFGGCRLMLASLASGEHPDPRLRDAPILIDAEKTAGYLGDNIRGLLIDAGRRVLAQAD